MSIKNYWAAMLDCGCTVHLDYDEHCGTAVVDGGRIVQMCVLHGIGQSIAELKSTVDGL
ncbi:hypothetical protein ACFYU5_18900 [Nocardia aobensis]|uniref:Uncharacterized protein n=1 Tax=Nocardia aobensis TaxID=257277 RepID=A0ABW6P5Q2_9NOCA